MMNRTLNFIFVIAVVLFGNTAWAQPSVGWTKGLGWDLSDGIRTVMADAGGNVYSAGWFKYQIDIDPGPANYVLNSSSYLSYFLLKTDANGNFCWANQIDNSDYFLEVRALELDANGNLYVGGSFSENLFVTINGVSNTYISNGTMDVFIAKLDTAGNFVWLKTLGGLEFDYLEDLKIDPAGNLYFCGGFEELVDFDFGPGVTTLNSPNNMTGYVAKLDANGNFLWVKELGGLGYDRVMEMALDSQGNICLSGRTSAAGDYDPGPGVVTLNVGNVACTFNVKLDGSGNFIWANTFTPQGSCRPLGLMVDDQDNWIVSGRYSGTIDLDPGAGTSLHTSNGQDDAYLAKLNSNGSLVWGVSMGGTGFEVPVNAVWEPGGNIWLAGTFQNSMDLDPGSGTQMVNSIDGKDVFILQLDGNGNFLWGGREGGTGDQSAWSMAPAPNGGVYLGGEFYETSDFDPNNAFSPITSQGLGDGFLQRILTCQTANTSISPTVCQSFTTNQGAILTSSGNYTEIYSTTSGCDSVVTIMLTVNGPTGQVYNSGLALTCLDNNATYQWVDCSNGFAPIAGETGQSFVPNGAGFYAVIVSMNGCTDTSACQVILGTAVAGQMDGPALQVYPNPSEGKVFVKMPGNSALSVFNSLGQMIRQQEMKGETEMELPDGVYFLRIEQDGQVETRKLIIAK